MLKRAMAAAFALALLGGASALAQPADDNHPKNGGGGQPHNGGQPHGGPAPAGVPHGGPAPAGVPHGGPPPGGAPHGGPAPGGLHPGAGGAPLAPPRTYSGPNPYQGGQHTYVGPTGGPTGGRPPGGAPNGGPAPSFHPGPGGYHPNFGAPGVQPGGARPHYAPQFFPHAVYPQQRFHWRGEWAPPPGFYYRHWVYGDHLPWGWFAQSFWIDDYYDYDLPVPPYGYEWVRVGPDAVLVDLSDGLVVETVYGAFY